MFDEIQNLDSGKETLTESIRQNNPQDPYSSSQLWQTLVEEDLLAPIYDFDSLDEKLHPKKKPDPKQTLHIPISSLKVFAFGLVIFGFILSTYLISNRTTEKIDPRISELEESEQHEFASILRNDFNTKRNSLYPSAAIGKIANSVSRPKFLIASTLPEDAKLELIIEAWPDSLIGQFEFKKKLVVTVHDGLSTPVYLLSSIDESLPMGEFKLTLVCKSCEPVNQTKNGSERGFTDTVLTEKSYFLGGKKDLNYDLELTSYHENLRKKARAELNELSEIASTLQIVSSGYVTPMKLYQEVSGLVKKWEALADEKAVFYYEQIPALQKAFNEVAELASIREKVKNPLNPQRPILLDRAKFLHLEIERDLQNLIANLNMLGELPLSANGMPRKVWKKTNIKDQATKN